MLIDDDQYAAASKLANEIVDFADCEGDRVSAMACLMAATTFLAEAEIEIGHAARILRVLLTSYLENNEIKND